MGVLEEVAGPPFREAFGVECVSAWGGCEAPVEFSPANRARPFGHYVTTPRSSVCGINFPVKKVFTGFIYNLLAQPAVEVFGELDVVEAAVVAIATDAAA